MTCHNARCAISPFRVNGTGHLIHLSNTEGDITYNIFIYYILNGSLNPIRDICYQLNQRCELSDSVK